MFNRRGGSDSHLGKFFHEESDIKYSSFIPNFKRTEQEENDYRKSLFPDEESDSDEGLLINFDTLNFDPPKKENYFSQQKFSYNQPKKAQSQKHVSNYKGDKLRLDSQTPPYYPKSRTRAPNDSQNINPNIPFSNNLRHLQAPSKLDPQQFKPAQSHAQYYNYNLNTINNTLHQYTIQREMDDFSTNMLRQSPLKHQMKYSSNEYELPTYQQEFPFWEKPVPRKTFSDKALKPLLRVGEQPMRSLFTKEPEINVEEINLADMLEKNFNMTEYVKTQIGSRIMQKELSVISPENLDLLLDKIRFNLPDIMTDIYGNYFVQRLVQSCSPEQRVFILKAIFNYFTSIACHNWGTHSIQCMMDIINTREEEEIVKIAVSKDILKVSFDPNATHVMQKIISLVEEEDRELINKLKKLITGNRDLALRTKILKKVSEDCMEIIQNAFGNYVVQQVLEEWGVESCANLLNVILSNIISLSMQKFSSNVVEKCLDLLDKETRQKWVREIFNFSKISSLLKNKYGNFVLQKAILTMSDDEKREIKEYLIKKVNLISNKEKSRLISLIDIIN